MSIDTKKSILLVEDEILIGMSEKLALEQYGYNVVTVNTGEKAIALFNKPNDIDLILMDIDLGKGIDGTETASLILKEHDIPILFLSSHTEPDVVNKTDKITSYGYVVKDSSITVLDASIKMAFKLLELNKKVIDKEEKYRAIVENTTDYIMRYDKECKHLFGNTRAIVSTGLALNEYIGKTHRDLGFPEHLCSLWEMNIEKVFTTGISQTMEFEVKLGNRNTFRELLLSPEFNTDGSVNSVIGISRDITERKENEALLVASETRYRRLFESAQDGILILDADTGMIMDVNPFLIKMLGFTHQDFLGKSILDIGFWKDIFANTIKFSELQIKEYIRYENLPLETVDGQKIDVEFVSNVYLVNNKKVIQCNIRDITERKHAELVAANKVLVFQNIEKDKRAAELAIANNELAFQNSEKEKRAAELVIANKELAFQNTEKDKRAAELIIANKELIFQNSEKKKRASELTIADKELVFQNDEKEKRTAELIIANKHIEQNELILKEIHHRIKNNMNTIISMLNLQANRLKDPSAIDALADAGSRVQSMMVLYNKLYQSVDFQKISIKQYLPSLVDEVVANFPNSSIVKIEKHIDDFILSAKILQPVGIIINELLTNIMKYAFVGKSDGLIVVSAALIDNHVSITVSDNGIGIPEEINFENSMGFGLQLVQALTQQLNGTMRVVRGNGTEIILAFDI
ncbi:MAG: PAS domain S-box protein [Treponemataceae bacterium]